MSWKKKILYGLLGAFALLQVYPRFSNDGSVDGPNAMNNAVTVPENVNAILSKACNDCHTNHTNKPWYTLIQPFDMWIGHHVDEGKEELNFSEFKSYPLKKQLHKIHEIEEVLKEGEMPLDSYTWMHGDAKLSDKEKQTLYNWVEEAMTELKGGVSINDEEEEEELD